MQYWILKTEPETFSFDDLKNRPFEMWDGVRNYQARNYLKMMLENDKCLIYHSGKSKGIVGLAQVVKTHYPDPTSDSDQWVCVDIQAVHDLPFFSLEQIKNHQDLKNIALLKQSRLSVIPITQEEFKILTNVAD